MRSLQGIKPQDILALMKLISAPKLTQKQLADALYISQAEISHGLKRLKNAKLITSDGSANIEASIEFFIHALKYICPAEFGAPSAGIPTSYAHPDFKYVKFNPAEISVWPHPEGRKRGVALIPIYATLPQACMIDEKLYKIAALVEMIRSGRAREKQIGSTELKKYIEKLNAK